MRGRTQATVKVRIGFKVKDPRIVPEMGAHVSFLDGTPEKQSGDQPQKPGPGVIVPAEAVQASGEASVAFVVTNDHVQRRSVRLGARTADGQIILSGIEPGDTMIVGEFDKLRNGLRVRIVQ